ncbi:MAG: hypothetical protein C4518_16880 [Desulfobacteraceae bacterium]|nr:MAG: hypothetical protein C4518_16880 [Desulfobacteraceae bacterium]
MILQKADVLKALCLLLAGFLFLVVPSYSFATGKEEIQVRRIHFDGITPFEINSLAASLVVQTPPFWKFWEPNPSTTPQEVEEDSLRVKHYYQSQGYYQATVEYTLTPVDPDKPTVPVYDVTYHIKEGLPVLIRGITIHGLSEIKTLDETALKAQLPLAAGNRFIVDDYEQSKILARKTLGNQGYPFASVKGRASVDLNDNRADITFDIEPGQRYHFGDIRVSGHEDFVREKVIRQAVTIAQGEQYSAKALDESRANLFDLTIFKTAAIKTGEPDPENKTLPVDIVVKPRKKQSVKFGVGYGTDDGLRLQGVWTYRNLTGYADRLSVRARRSDILENIYGEYQFPFFLSARNDLVTTAGYEHKEEDYYTLDKTASETVIYHKLKLHWLTSVGYKLEANRPKDVRATDPDSVTDPRDTESFRVSSVNFSIQRSTVDDVLRSTKGSVINLSLEDATLYLGTEVSYLSPRLEAKAFAPLPWKMVLAGRVDFQTIQKIEGTDYIPISKQFFMGGSKSVRGYGYEKMGVVNTDDTVIDTSGQSSFLANLELRFPIYEELGGVVFLDSGVLSQDTFQADIGNLRYAAGTGLRYYTIIGPVQLDFGYKLNPAKRAINDAPDLVSLANKDRWYLHFNIGQTF